MSISNILSHFLRLLGTNLEKLCNGSRPVHLCNLWDVVTDTALVNHDNGYGLQRIGADLSFDQHSSSSVIQPRAYLTQAAKIM